MSHERSIESVLHAFAIWTLSSALLVGSLFIMPADTAVAIRLFTSPVLAVVVSTAFYGKYANTRPLGVALVFAATVAILDAAVLAAGIARSFSMFLEPLATWVPYALIFVSTWGSGALMTVHRTPSPHELPR